MKIEDIEKYIEKIHVGIVDKGYYILEADSPDMKNIEVRELITDAYREKYGKQLKEYYSNPPDGDICFAECRNKLPEKRFKNSIIDDDIDNSQFCN